jgi:hypothetical protein
MEEQLDPSQRPAVPVKPVEAGELLRQLRTDRDAFLEAVPEETANAIKNNREHAQQEISMIFELNESQAFRWFMEEFVIPEYDRVFGQLRGIGEPPKPEDLPAIQVRYATLRGIRIGMLEREIAHRSRLDPNDSEIPRLREKLNLL